MALGQKSRFFFILSPFFISCVSNIFIKISSKDLPVVSFVVTQHSESALSLCLRYSKTSCAATKKIFLWFTWGEFCVTFHLFGGGEVFVVDVAEGDGIAADLDDELAVAVNADDVALETFEDAGEDTELDAVFGEFQEGVT